MPENARPPLPVAGKLYPVNDLPQPPDFRLPLFLLPLVRPRSLTPQPAQRLRSLGRWFIGGLINSHEYAQDLIRRPPFDVLGVGAGGDDAVLIPVHQMHLPGLQPGHHEGRVRGGKNLQAGEMIQQRGDDAALPGGMQVVLDFVDEQYGRLLFPS